MFIKWDVTLKLTCTKGDFVNKVSVVLLAILAFSHLSQAQSLQELKQQYEDSSPLQYQEMAPQALVAPEESDKTPAEEAIAARQEEDLEKQKFQEERIYLDTDYRFFQSLNVTLDEDELDKAYKAKQEAELQERLLRTESTVKTEINSTTPGILPPQQGVAMDGKRELILKKIAANGQQVRACIRQHKNIMEFKGTSMTLTWEVEPSGKVANAQLKTTDIDDQGIQKCILEALAGWDFSDATKVAGPLDAKNSLVEYTYRFVNSRKEAAAN